MAEFLTPEEIGAYQQRRNTTNRSYGTAAAKLAYGRQTADQDYNRNRTKLTDAWNNKFEGFGAGYARRGLNSNSGIFKRGMQNYLKARQDDFTDNQYAYNKNLANFDFQQRDIEDQRFNSLAGIEAETQARRSQLAAQLKAIFG